MNRPVVGYNRLCVDARPLTTSPPNGFASAQNSGEFCALRFGRLPEISRFAVPQKRAKLTSTSRLFRRQSAKFQADRARLID